MGAGGSQPLHWCVRLREADYGQGGHGGFLQVVPHHTGHECALHRHALQVRPAALEGII